MLKRIIVALLLLAMPAVARAEYRVNPLLNSGLDYYENATTDTGFTKGTGKVYLSTATDAVGLGDTAANSKLYIEGNKGFLLRLANTLGSDKLAIMDNGNVGIGTTAPAGVLQIGATASVPYLLIDSAGEVGIGTSAPGRPLHVAGGLRLEPQADQPTEGALGDVYVDTDNNMYYYNGTAWEDVGYTQEGQWGNGPTGAIYYSSGNVGIGVTGPTEALDVVGNIVASGTITANYLVVGDGTAPGRTEIPGSMYIIGNTLGADHLTVTTPSGNIGIGLTNPAQKLQVAGFISTADTEPLMRLNVMNPNSADTYPGATLSIARNMKIEKAYAQTTGGTNLIFNVRQHDSTGTTPLYALMAGQTMTTTLLTIAGGAEDTVPAGNLVVLDIISESGTVPGARLELYGRQY